MKSFGLWLLSVTLLGITLGCGDTEEKPVTPPPADPPAEAPSDPAP
jgi:hypothetical protein